MGRISLVRTSAALGLFDGLHLGHRHVLERVREQEKNGLMTYDRKFKFNPEIFYKINTQKAGIEKTKSHEKLMN